jgi:hypothetical protein
MTAAEALRHAADVVEDSAIGQRKERVIRLLACYIVRACGSGECAEEARLLIELLNDEGRSSTAEPPLNALPTHGRRDE